jgi:hypothetical protein
VSAESGRRARVLAAAQRPASFVCATIDYQAAWHAASALYATLRSGGPDGGLGVRSLPESSGDLGWALYRKRRGEQTQ